MSVESAASVLAARCGGPPASVEDLLVLKAGVAGWHPDLDTLFAVLDGSQWLGLVAPTDHLLTAREVLTATQMSIDISVDVHGAEVVQELEEAPAGSVSDVFSRQMIRFSSDGAGDAWVMDCRPGEFSGRVYRWYRVEGLMFLPHEHQGASLEAVLSAHDDKAWDAVDA